jgi:hypothetical protein
MERQAMDHNSAVKLEACEKYVLGELSPELREAYEAHYFSCAECAAQLRSAVEFAAGSRQVFAESPAVAAKAGASRERSGWFAWLRPAVAVPAFAALLLLIGYQNFFTIPRLKESAAPRVLPMFSLIAANTRGETVPEFSARPDEPLGLYVDVPADPAYSSYVIRLQDPNGNTVPLRSLSYAEAQKTQVVVINPGKAAGNYSLVVLGQAKPAQGASSGTELARMQFTVVFSGQVQQH